jgi:methionyl-tRNA formyltransferase
LDEGLFVNLVFIGSSKFGLRCLSTCLEIPNLSIVGVVTAPQIFTISYRPSGVNNVLHADITSLASQHAIPVRKLANSMNDPGLFDSVTGWNPDAFLVAGWYHMIPKMWRDLAPAYGLHASLLPNYSGGAPLVWAMINGEKKTGITLFQMDDGVDSGPIAGQKEEPIHLNDTIASLYARIEERGLELLRDLLPQIASGTLKLQNQDEKNRLVLSQRSPEDGQIDWTMDATFIDRFVRAQTKPYPGAFTTMNGEPLHVWSTRVAAVSEESKPGYVKKGNDGTYSIGCNEGAVTICEISYKQKTYTESQLSKLFGGGGQIRGESPSGFRSSEPC